jgi:hypothetical protein
MSKLVKVAETKAVAPGTGKVVDAQGRRLALFNVAGTFHAIDNTCTQQGGPLGEGEEGEDVRRVDAAGQAAVEAQADRLAQAVAVAGEQRRQGLLIPRRRLPHQGVGRRPDVSHGLPLRSIPDAGAP